MPAAKKPATNTPTASPSPSSEPRRRERRERRHEHSRAEILEAARQVILRGGITAATLEAVAREVGVSKAALYYYYPSKDALLFELIFGALETHAHSVDAAVDQAKDGAAALGAVMRETVKGFAPRLDDFRLAFLYGQVASGQAASPGAVQFDAEQFARIRPLNDLILAGVVEKLVQDGRTGRAGVEPRLLAFLAYLAAIGTLTMKGLVQSMNDPLVYSDEQLIDGLARIFAAAASP